MAINKLEIPQSMQSAWTLRIAIVYIHVFPIQRRLVQLFCAAVYVTFIEVLDANVHAARSAPKSETAADVTN